jgi:hypothetical protein
LSPEILKIVNLKIEMVKTQAEFNISKINIANDQLQKKLQEEI